MIGPRHIEVDGRQNGKLGIAEILVAAGIADNLESAVSKITTGSIYANGNQLSNPTKYPNLFDVRAIVEFSPDRGKVLDYVLLDIKPPYRVIIE